MQAEYIKPKYIPFQRDIPRFPATIDEPAESSAMLPNEATTVLDNQQALDSIRLIRQFLDAPTNSLRRGVTNTTINFSGANYPSNYDVLKNILLDQIEITKLRTDDSQEKLELYETLLRQIKTELEPPENFRIGFQFQAHYVPKLTDFQRMKDEVKTQMRKVFVKGEQNIYFGEDADGLQGEAFKKAFAKTGSYAYAAFYYEIKNQLGREPTLTELKEMAQRRRATFLNNRSNIDFRYAILEEDAVDELIAEGYSITVEHEKGSKSFAAQMKDLDTSTLEGFKNAMRKIMKLSAQRNQVIVKQIEELEKSAVESGKRTNLFVLMGFAHRIIADQLPARLKAVTTSEIDSNDALTGQFALSEYLMLGKEPPEDVWENAFFGN